MFCLMDVSGSMSEHMKDLAKRFYMLLYVFLTGATATSRSCSFATPIAPRKWTNRRSSRPGFGRNAGLERVAGDARDIARALPPGRLEYLCGAGVGRRQFLFGFRADGAFADRSDIAGHAIFRLSRSRAMPAAEVGDGSKSSLWSFMSACAPRAHRSPCARCAIEAKFSRCFTSCSARQRNRKEAAS